MVAAETRASIEEWEAVLGRRATAAEFEPVTWALGLLGRQFSAGDLAKAMHLIKGASRPVGQFFEQYDLLLTPTLSMPPVVIGALQPKASDLAVMKTLGRLNAGKLLRAVANIDALAADTFAFIPFPPVFNATGQPAMSLPLYWNEEGLPIGIHFVGRYGDEATLFRLAAQLESARPWFDRIPLVHS
jgi:amidase